MSSRPPDPFDDSKFRERRRAISRAFRARHRAKIRARWVQEAIARRYGLSPSDYLALFNAQGGRCAICREKSERRLAVDHCHVTRKVRRLLCTRCNSGLAMFRDDIGLLRAAIEYLERTRREPAWRTVPATPAAAADSSQPVHNQKGTRMTQHETVLDDSAIPTVADAPPLVPVTTRPRQQRQAAAPAASASLTRQAAPLHKWVMKVATIYRQISK